MSSPDPLTRVKRAARAKSRADAQYREALRSALEAGYGFAELAAVLGMSRQAVRQLAGRLTR